MNSNSLYNKLHKDRLHDFSLTLLCYSNKHYDKIEVKQFRYKLTTDPVRCFFPNGGLYPSSLSSSLDSSAASSSSSCSELAELPSSSSANTTQGKKNWTAGITCNATEWPKVYFTTKTGGHSCEPLYMTSLWYHVYSQQFNNSSTIDSTTDNIRTCVYMVCYQWWYI